MSNSLNPDQDRQNVGPDLGQTVCKRFSADDKRVMASKERVKYLYEYKRPKWARIAHLNGSDHNRLHNSKTIMAVRSDQIALSSSESQCYPVSSHQVSVYL